MLQIDLWNIGHPPCVYIRKQGSALIP